MEHLIEVTNVSFGYEDIPVLEDVSLNIFEKDFVLIIGPNGGGKTTLLKLIIGIIKPWMGSIHIHKDVSGRVGYVPQYASFNRNFPISAFEMVLTGCINTQNYFGKYKKDDIEKTGRILEKVNMYARRHENINNLSGGQIQKVLIARALVSEPLVLFLDEPTASIDITSKTSLMDFLNELNEKMAIAVVTHDPTPFAPTYRHIACLNKNLYFHERGELDTHVLEYVYGCPVELLGHGIPHTLLKKH
ncbi:MAG: ABC transporter ATP-binding protein [Syntrophales bacterium]